MPPIKRSRLALPGRSGGTATAEPRANAKPAKRPAGLSFGMNAAQGSAWRVTLRDGHGLHQGAGRRWIAADLQDPRSASSGASASNYASTVTFSEVPSVPSHARASRERGEVCKWNI